MSRPRRGCSTGNALREDASGPVDEVGAIIQEKALVYNGGRGRNVSLRHSPLDRRRQRCYLLVTTRTEKLLMKAKRILLWYSTNNFAFVQLVKNYINYYHWINKLSLSKKREEIFRRSNVFATAFQVYENIFRILKDRKRKEFFKNIRWIVESLIYIYILFEY